MSQNLWYLLTKSHGIISQDRTLHIWHCENRNSNIVLFTAGIPCHSLDVSYSKKYVFLKIVSNGYILKGIKCVDRV
jgi:hypothetical protein